MTAADPSSAKFLRRSFELAHEARGAGDHPFGALLAIDGRVVAEARNRVVSDHDITAHAETQLVRVLERDGRLPMLAGGTVYASCEPCPMCMGALFWAGATHIAYGLSAASLTALATAPGADPIAFTITANELGVRSMPAVRVEGPQLEDEAAEAHAGFWNV